MRNIAVLLSLLMLLQSCYSGSITLDQAVVTRQKVQITEIGNTQTQYRFHHIEHKDGVYKGIKWKDPSSGDRILEPKNIDKIKPRDKLLSTLVVVVPVTILAIYAIGLSKYY